MNRMDIEMAKPDSKSAKEHIVDVLRETGEVFSPLEMSEVTNISHNTVKGTMNQLAKEGVISKRSRGHYYFEAKSQTSSKQRVGESNGDVSGEPDSSFHKSSQVRAVPVWGGEAPGHTDRMMHLDSDLLNATGISLDGTTVIPVMGSSAEPYLSHGQIALATPITSIQGEDLYVYYSWSQQAHLVAWMDSASGIITMTTASRQTEYKPTGTDDVWERGDDGRKEKFRIVGRVVGAVMPVNKQRAQKQELVRMLLNE